MRGETIAVSLSTPSRALVPITRPSATPGLLSTAGWAHCAAIVAALPTQRARSRPIAAAGTRPNGDRAEYRPPIDDTPEKMRRKPSRLAAASSFDPGSVIATKCRGACAAPTAATMRSKK